MFALMLTHPGCADNKKSNQAHSIVDSGYACRVCNEDKLDHTSRCDMYSSDPLDRTLYTMHTHGVCISASCYTMAHRPPPAHPPTYQVLHTSLTSCVALPRGRVTTGEQKKNHFCLLQPYNSKPMFIGNAIFSVPGILKESTTT